MAKGDLPKYKIIAKPKTAEGRRMLDIPEGKNFGKSIAVLFANKFEGFDLAPSRKDNNFETTDEAVASFDTENFFFNVVKVEPGKKGGRGGDGDDRGGGSGGSWDF